MPTSVIAAVMAKYDTLAFTPRPPVYFQEAPTKDAAGAAVAPPFVELFDLGTTFQFTFEYVPVETTTFRLDVYAPTLAAADAICDGVRFGGGGTTARLGLDHCPDLPLTGLAGLDLSPGRVVRSLDGPRGGTASLVYKVSLTYTATAQRL